MEIKPNNKCDDCGDADNIKHHFYYCVIVIKFWKQLKILMVDNLSPLTIIMIIRIQNLQIC